MRHVARMKIRSAYRSFIWKLNEKGTIEKPRTDAMIIYIS